MCSDELCMASSVSFSAESRTCSLVSSRCLNYRAGPQREAHDDDDDDDALKLPLPRTALGVTSVFCLFN